jgi:hypothetical protein
MTITTDQIVIDKPGIYDMPADGYHRDPVPGGSLSSSGARRLLPPSCPALFRYEQDHGQGHKKVWDYGHAAHHMVLGTGPELRVADVEEWRTKEARDFKAAAYDDGAVPLKRAEYEQVLAMAAVLRRHPVASALFDPKRGGRPEQSLFWKDKATGVNLRARLDWLPAQGPGRFIVPDYKTAHDVSPEGIQKAVHQHGYHQQAPWYLDGVKALGLAEDPAFVFVFQQKTPPYIVTVIQLDQVAMEIGRELNRDAISLYRECKRSGRWPAFSDEIELIQLPAWAEKQHERMKESA